MNDWKQSRNLKWGVASLVILCKGSLRLIRSLGALGDPSGDDLTVCPALAVVLAPPAVSGKLGIGISRNLRSCPPWDWSRKTVFLNCLPHNRTKVSGSWTEIDSFHINVSRSISPFISSNDGGGCVNGDGVGKLFQDMCFFFKKIVCLMQESETSVGGSIPPQKKDFPNWMVRPFRMSSD